MSSYWDKHGNILPNNVDTQSENPSTFNAAYFLNLAIYKGIKYSDRNRAFGLIMAKYSVEHKQFLTIENDENLSFSLDEKISIAALANFYDLKRVKSKIRLFTADISHYNPYVFFFVLQCRYPIFKILNTLLLIPRLFIEIYILMALHKFKDEPEQNSSGAQKAFIMLYGGRMQTTIESLCDESYYPDWHEVFKIYYRGDDDHPTVALAAANMSLNKY